MTILGQPFFIKYSRWLRVMLKRFYERRIVYKSNGTRTANSVKGFLGPPLSRVKSRAIQYLGGLTDRAKVLLTCQYQHLAEIQEIKSISKPQLLVEVCTT